MKRTPFESIYRHGFVRLAIGIPAVRLGNPLENAERTVKLAERASGEHAAVIAFPELGLSGYSNEDLFHQEALLEASVAALGQVLEASRRPSGRDPRCDAENDRLSPAFLRDEPVQAISAAERAKGGLRRITVTAKRLARTERWSRGCVAAGARKRGTRVISWREPDQMPAYHSYPSSSHVPPLPPRSLPSRATTSIRLTNFAIL
jgi:hypothetical protein